MILWILKNEERIVVFTYQLMVHCLHFLQVVGLEQPQGVVVVEVGVALLQTWVEVVGVELQIDQLYTRKGKHKINDTSFPKA